MQSARKLFLGEDERGAGAPRGSLGRKRLRVGVLQGVASWDPQHAHDLVTYLIHAQIYETPYQRLTVDLDPSPRLFVGMLDRETTDTRTTWSGVVRRNTTFSDGTELDAERMVESLARSSSLTDRVSVFARDERVCFEAEEDLGALENLLAKRWCSIALQTKGGFVGTGPFMRAISPSEDRIRLVRNPRHRTVAALDEIVFTVYPDAAALIYAIRHGEVDFTMELSDAEALQLENVHRLSHPDNSTGMLFFNTQRPALADPAVRRAIAAALDRRQLTRICHPEAAGLTARSAIPPRMGRHEDQLRFDPDRAREKLAELGPPARGIGPLRMAIVWGPRPYLPAPLPTALSIQKQLRAAGVEIEIVRTSDSREFTGLMQSGDYDLALGGWIADTEDPHDFVTALVSPDAIPVPSRPAAVSANFSRWHDPETSTLLRHSAGSMSPATLRAIVARIADQAPFVPLMHGAAVVVHTDRVQGYMPTGNNIPNFARIDLAEGPRTSGRT